MSIRSKITRLLEPADVLVYQPGRVGSTAIVNFYKTNNIAVKHLHSVGIDRVYFLKPERYLLIINNFLAFIYGSYLRLVNVVLRRQTKIVVPIRNQDKRDESAFWEHFEIACYRSIKSKWYKELYKKKPDDFIKKLKEEYKIKNGIDLWLKNELSSFASYQFDDSVAYLNQGITKIDTRSFSITLINVECPEVCKLYELHNQLENTGEQKWIKRLIK